MDWCARHVRRMFSVPRLKRMKSRVGPRTVFQARTSCITPTTTRWSKQSTDFTHGPQRGLFVGIVVALALVSLYFPVRDLYVAKRSSDILAKQVEIREQYNDDLQKSVDKLLSEEGIKDAASEDLGLVMPGEKRIEVQGLDDDSDPSSSQKSSNAKKASEVAKEIEEVGKDVPWYIQALDMLFGFNGVEGQTVVSNGK